MAGAVRTGSCLCGAVAYEVTGKTAEVVCCHCTQCRKQSGHYVAATRVELSDFRLTVQEGLVWYRASPQARRGFCRKCGSALFWQQDAAGTISVFAGSFDGASRLRTRAHIFVADKGDYYDIFDGLPQYPQAD